MQDQSDHQYKLKRKVAKRDVNRKVIVANNRDLIRIPNFRGNFSKAFPHTNGIVDKHEYKKLLRGIFKQSPKDLLKIKLGSPNGFKLVDFSTLYDLDVIGPYKGTYKIPVAPRIESAEAAADMVEIYELALARDVPYCQWDTSPVIATACANLSSLIDYKGPTVGPNKTVTPRTIFRGDTVGDLIGPFMAQFLLYPIKYGLLEYSQRCNYPPPSIDYMTTIPNYLSCWNGTITEKAVASTKTNCYMATLRDSTAYHHVDEPGELFLNTALILISLNVPPFNGNPYTNGIIKDQTPFVSLSHADLYDLLFRACRMAMDVAWYVKLMNLRLRPEEFAYQIQCCRNGDRAISFHSDIINNSVLQRIYASQGNYLMPQAYVEGAPCHPSYPSAHSTVAGAMSTILKAWFDCSFQLPHSYVASVDGQSLLETGDTLTVGNEIDKLASNCALFRCAAGIHYRSDGNGLALGEAVAIALLEEMVGRYSTPVKFDIKKRDGKRIAISNM